MQYICTARTNKPESKQNQDHTLETQAKGQMSQSHRDWQTRDHLPAEDPVHWSLTQPCCLGTEAQWEREEGSLNLKHLPLWRTFFFISMWNVYCSACCVSSTWTESWIPEKSLICSAKSLILGSKKEENKKYFALSIAVEISAKRVWIYNVILSVFTRCVENISKRCVFLNDGSPPSFLPSPKYQNCRQLKCTRAGAVTQTQNQSLLKTQHIKWSKSEDKFKTHWPECAVLFSCVFQGNFQSTGDDWECTVSSSPTETVRGQFVGSLSESQWTDLGHAAIAEQSPWEVKPGQPQLCCGSTALH